MRQMPRVQLVFFLILLEDSLARGRAYTGAMQIFPLSQQVGQQAGESRSIPSQTSVRRHYSDTRTPEGRVRFVLLEAETGHAPAQQVELYAEGQGWQHHSLHASLAEAAAYLATLPYLSSALHVQALHDLRCREKMERVA